MMWIEKTSFYRATILYTPNFGLQYVVGAIRNNVFKWDLSSVRLIYNGAEPIIDSITKAFLAALKPYKLSDSAMYPVYGMAEATVGISLPDPGDPYTTHIIRRDQLKVGCRVEYSDYDDQNVIAFVEVGRPLPSC
ncbi:MAG: hypothetical protein ACKO96_08920, partial [Flammeovirgaceae bacterium]